jgi:uncharacterized membrane protein (DUF106 family)
MTEEKQAAPDAQNPLSMCQGPSGFIFILSFGFLMLIMFDRDLGDSVSDIIGLFLYPVIGFGGNFPIFTMLGAGFLTIIISTTIRHFTMDWLDLAKKQRIMNEYNKAVREATKAGNQSRVEKLQSENQEIMGMQSSMMMGQMKASILSMVIAILIYRWLYSFIWEVAQPTVTVPWDMAWPLTGSAFSAACGSICMNPSGGGIPFWIFVYIPITVPIGQALMRGLKYFEFSSKLKKKGEDVFGPAGKLQKEEATDKSEDKKDQKRPREAKKPPSDGGKDRKKGGKGKKKGSGKRNK